MLANVTVVVEDTMDEVFDFLRSFSFEVVVRIVVVDRVDAGSNLLTVTDLVQYRPAPQAANDAQHYLAQHL